MLILNGGMSMGRDQNRAKPYIPENHRKYPLLPSSRKDGGEVFSYPSELLSEVEAILPRGVGLTPYGYDSYEEYFAQIDKYVQKYADSDRDKELFEKYKAKVAAMNQKEDWSVLRYLGPTTDELFGLTHGNVYYWPCSKDAPVYEGVIDDEEFTSYLYSTEPEDWEILEDPTGMAYNTMFNRAKGYMSRKDYDHIQKQLKAMEGPRS